MWTLWAQQFEDLMRWTKKRILAILDIFR